MKTKNIIDKNPTKIADNLNDLVLKKTNVCMNCYEKAQAIADVLEEVVEIFEKKTKVLPKVSDIDIVS